MSWWVWLGIFVSAVIAVIAVIVGGDGCGACLVARVECAADDGLVGGVLREVLP